MNSIRNTALAVLAAACATGAGFAQAADGDAWSMARIAARAIEADPAVRASGALAGIAATQYALELDKASPKFALEIGTYCRRGRAWVTSRHCRLPALFLRASRQAWASATTRARTRTR